MSGRKHALCQCKHGSRCPNFPSEICPNKSKKLIITPLYKDENTTAAFKMHKIQKDMKKGQYYGKEDHQDVSLQVQTG